jgi:virginiamycin B lyase
MSQKSFLPAFAVLLGAMPAAAQPVLPDGPGKVVVENACQACHALSNITNAGHTPKDWDAVVHMMINAGAKLPPDQVPVAVNYLAAHFPARARPAPQILAGNVRVTIREWDVPTQGSRPHDPMFAPDGSVWYSGQMANVLGRFDPKTQTFREFHLPDGSGPHGLIAAPDGNVWYTANFKAYIGKLDPKTGKVTQYPMPDPRAHDPHTLLLAPNSYIYFTAQNANMVGRLNPKTGEIKLVNSPTPRSNPYGMVIDSHGVPYYVEFGSNKVARIDPDTLAIREFVLPNADARPRRVAITADDIIWYSDYARGFLGRLDPKTGAVTEWPSPGGPRSQPYGITAIGDAIWYSESNTSPNSLVRFDTRSHQFQTWAIPSGGGVVRNMVATPDGNLWLACSGVNKIAFVEIGKAAAVR